MALVPRARRPAVIVAATVLAAVASSCGTPSPEAFLSQSDKALEDASSAVATTGTALDQLRFHKLPVPYGRVVVTEQEEALGSTQQSYTASQPPESEQAVYDSTSDLLEDASGLVTEARIAVQRGQRSTYARIRADLAEVGSQIAEAREEIATAEAAG
ncbi:hypothetical protein [Mumia sp. DW29H23]|uniref:hypothetical protein n=1 Tax=Mumia sp. DW29H23 TaxID=3421241 RepID=UPI003D687ED9